MTNFISDPYIAEQKAIERLVYEIFDAGKKKDIVRLESYHLYGPKFTKYDDEFPYKRIDADEGKKGEREGFLSLDDFEIHLSGFKADIFGDFAIATFDADYSVRQGTKKTAAKSRCTLVFVKAGGGWKITHEHFSKYYPN